MRCCEVYFSQKADVISNVDIRDAYAHIHTNVSVSAAHASGRMLYNAHSRSRMRHFAYGIGKFVNVAAAFLLFSFKVTNGRETEKVASAVLVAPAGCPVGNGWIHSELFR